MISSVDVQTAKKWLDDGQAVVVDVREPSEHIYQNIPGSRLCSLDTLNDTYLQSTTKKVLLYCQSGVRSAHACRKILDEIDLNSASRIYTLEGGLEAWKAMDFPIQTNEKSSLPLTRQVHIVVGLCVMTLGLLGYIVHPSFALGAAFFGAGLMNAGLTGWCGLAKIIARMPWNR